MADDSQRLVIDLEARLTNFEKSMKRAGVVADTNWKGVEARGQSAARRIDSSFARISRPRKAEIHVEASGLEAVKKAVEGIGLEHLKAGVGGIAAGLGLAEVAKFADEWQSASNKIASAHVEAAKVPIVLQQVSEMAERSRVSLESAAQVYAGMSRAAHNFGATQSEVAIAAETVSKALATSGSTTQEQQGAINDLVQGMQAGVLQGQELRALLGEVPAIAEAIAREFKVSVGQVKELGTNGELTADRVFKAIVAAAPEVDKTFAKTTATVAQSFQNLETAATRFIGQNAVLHAGTTGTTAALQGLAGNFGTAATAAGVLGLVIASRLVSAGLTPLATALAANVRSTAAAAAAQLEFATITGTMNLRMAAATVAARGLSGALALVGGPVGAVLLGVTAATVYYASRAQEAEARSKLYADALAKVRDQAESATPAVHGLGDAVAETSARMNAVTINRLSQQLKQAEVDAADTAEQLRQLSIFTASFAEYRPNSAGMKEFFALVEKALTGDTKAALDAQRAIDDLANLDPNFQQIADSFNPLLEKLAGVRASIAATKASIADLSGAAAKAKPDTSFAGTLDVAGEKAGFAKSQLQENLDKAENSDAYRARQKQAATLKEGDGLGIDPGRAYENALQQIKLEDAPSGKGRKGGKSQAQKNADADADQDAEDQKKIDDQIAELEKQLREQQAVAAATKGLTEGTLAYNTAKQTAIELSKNQVDAASAEGRQITDLAGKIEQAKDAEDKLAKQREALKTAGDSFANSFADALDDVILKGKNAGQVFASLAATLESEALKGLLTGGGPLGGLFSGATGSSGGILGAIMGGVGKVFGVTGFADGGKISGPGTGRSDSILARVSSGEFVVNSAATKANLPLLHAINQGKLPAFADGGLVTPVAMPAASVGGGKGGDVHLHSNVTLNASGGTPEQNRDLARQASAQLEATMRKIVSSELQAQMRPGNMLNR